MDQSPVDLTFCLIVPSGRWNLAPLVAAIRAHHTAPTIVAVWCGDPHRRPVLDPALGVRWADTDLTEPNGIGWGRLLCGLRPRSFEWTRTAAAVLRLIDRAASRVIVLRLGSVAVLGDVSTSLGEGSITLVAKNLEDVRSDGLAPTPRQALDTGLYSTVIASFTAGSRAGLKWLVRDLVEAHSEVGPTLDRMSARFATNISAPLTTWVCGWGSAPDGSPVLLDLDHLDRDEPWHFDFGGTPARSRLSVDVRLAQAVALGSPQLEGSELPLKLPGGIVVDDAICGLMTTALTAPERDAFPLPPEPFGKSNSRFVEWLEQPQPYWGGEFGRYWRELRSRRADLATTFPRPDSADMRRFLAWSRDSWRLDEGRSLLIRPARPSQSAPLVSSGWDHSGLNVIGYHNNDSSLGWIARAVIKCLHESSVPAGAHAFRRTASPLMSDPPSTSCELLFATNLAVVNADQFEALVADHGPELMDRRRTIGYWFWELETVPKAMVEALTFVDEVWAGSRFIQQAFAAVTEKPVRYVPIPVNEPSPSEFGRLDLSIENDRYVFLVTLDHFSVTERKNPVGAIEAFCRAFGNDVGPILLVKTTNGKDRWRSHERLLLAASGRSDVVIWDEHLSRADQMAVLAAADCLVSLHRSEGLGLHCAEAMWLGKPVIATAYSGNLDFMDNTVAAMIDYRLINVLHGEGVYPEDAVWADPNLDQAAAWMRRLVADPALGRTLGAKARARMQQQPTMAETGRMIAALAGLHPATPADANTSKGAM